METSQWMEDLVVEEVEVVLEVAKVCFYHFLIDWANVKNWQ